MRTWVLTGSPENLAVTREHGFSVIGLKERNRGRAEDIAPGDRIVFYVTGVQAFGAVVRVAGGMREDRTPIWPANPRKPEDYPWRFETEPELVLDEDQLVPAAELAAELEHVRKWPAEHWPLAFQGQMRRISDADARLIEQRMRAATARSEAPAVSAGAGAA